MLKIAAVEKLTNILKLHTFAYEYKANSKYVKHINHGSNGEKLGWKCHFSPFEP